MTVATAVYVLPRRMAGWAARRSLAPNALAGIGLACSICAAGWFSAGTRLDALIGGAALCAGYLARRIRAQVAADRVAREAARGAAAAGSITAGPMTASYAGWLAAICAALGELAVYAGLAAGASASQHRGIWLLATEAAITLSIRQVARVCQPARARPSWSQPPWRRPPWNQPPWNQPPWNQPAHSPPAHGQPMRGQPARGQHARAGTPAARAWFGTVAGLLLALPTGERTVAIAVTALIGGARITFLTLIVWGAAAAAWAVVESVWTPVGRMAAGGLTGGEVIVGGPAAHPWTWPAATPASPPAAGGIAACRDDGPAAQLAGRIVRGQLVPLPPALAGLAAVVLLAALGLGNLTGILVLAPVAAMLLAAPGAGHPHDGRLDWLVPLVLLAGQFVYLTALGFSAGVPGPVTFAMISLVALRQLDVACRARLAGWPPQRSRLGWDGRLVVVGIAALLGVATFAYVALAAYLGWLLCRASLSGWLAVKEPDLSARPEGR
jgi:Family of unknown function (DUF5941)